MKNLVIILCLLIFNSSAFSDSTNNLVTDKHKDNEWVVSYITKNSIHASVNGQVTHGDGLHVRFVKGKCDVGNLLTFVYSYSKNPDLVNFKNKYVTTEFMGKKVVLKVLFFSHKLCHLFSIILKLYLLFCSTNDFIFTVELFYLYRVCYF